MPNKPHSNSFQNPAVRSAIAGFFAMAIAMGIGRFVYTPILPYMIDASNLTTSHGGIAAGSNFIGYLIGALLAASPFFAPKRQKWMMIALVVSVFTTGLSGVWLKPFAIEFFYLARFLAGLASAFAMIFISTIVMQHFQSENRPELISVHFAGVGFGICSSALLVSYGANINSHWANFWFAAAIICVALLVLVWYFLPSSNPKEISQNNSVSNAEIEGAPKPFTLAFWLFLFGYCVFGFAYSISGTFLNTIAKIEPSLNSAQPFIWLVVGIAIIPSTWVWFKLAKKIGDMYAYSLACIVEALGALLIFLYVTPFSLLFSGFLFGFTFVAVTAIGLAKARRMAGARGAQAIALMTAAFGLGQMLGPIFAGFSAEKTGSFSTSLKMSVAMLLLACIFTMISKRLDHSTL